MANHRNGTEDDCALPATRLRLLALLSSNPIMGNIIRKRHDETYSNPIAQGTLYVGLMRLEEAGFVTSHHPGDNNKSYLYSITPSGKEALDKARKYYQRLSVFGLR